MAPTRPFVLIVTGLPGTGKSTLSDAVARQLGAPSFQGDWLMGALSPARKVLYELDEPAYLDLYHSLLGSLVTRQCLLGQSAIVDCVVPNEVLERWGALAAEHGHRFRVVECILSDRALHRSRIEGRVRGIPGWHEVDWDHVERMEQRAPLTAERLVVDALRPVEENVAAVVADLSGGQAVSSNAR